MGKKVMYFITSEDITGIELAMEHADDDEVTILLLQNAVYFANKANKTISQALSKNRKVAASKEDIDLRGLNNYISSEIKLVNSAEIIDMVFGNDTIINM